jgi:hypothetical protein
MEESDPINGWSQRALILRDMMMMMMSFSNVGAGALKFKIICQKPYRIEHEGLKIIFDF